jgi:hypothetical protein
MNIGLSAIPTVLGNNRRPTNVLIVKNVSIGINPSDELFPPQAPPMYENRRLNPQIIPIIFSLFFYIYNARPLIDDNPPNSKDVAAQQEILPITLMGLRNIHRCHHLRI